MCDVFYSFNQIAEIQIQAILEERLRMRKKELKEMQQEKGEVKFSCRCCSKPVCTGDDIQVIEKMHRVNVTPEFRYRFPFRVDTDIMSATVVVKLSL